MADEVDHWQTWEGEFERDEDLSLKVEAEMVDRLARTIAGEFDFITWDECKAEHDLDDGSPSGVEGELP